MNFIFTTPNYEKTLADLKAKGVKCSGVLLHTHSGKVPAIRLDNTDETRLFSGIQ